MVRLIAPLLACLALSAATTAGDNIDLSTIPPRDGVQLTIYNSEDLTLVRETRTLTFARGDNPLQFSWAGTLIDPTSVSLRFLQHFDRLDIIDTTFPHDRPQVLVWNVAAPAELSATVEITYFTSGITWATDYVLTAASDETTLQFDGFVRVTNNSGENYDDASIRLVVGSINLVEKVADLARRGMVSSDLSRTLEEQSIRFASERDRGVVLGEVMKSMDAAGAQRQIVKEGLSEYFIFTVEGKQDVPNTWSQRLPLFEGATVPNRVHYRYRPQQYGDQLVRLYSFRNDEASSLGTCPLPDGVVRVFRAQGPDDGMGDGLAFLTSFATTYVPIGQEIDVNLGRDPEVVYERRLLRAWRDQIWYQDRNGRTLLGPGDLQRVTDDDPVVGWDQHEQWTERVRNGRSVPIDVEIRQRFDGDIRLDGRGTGVTLFDAQTAQFSGTVAGGSLGNVVYTVTQRLGTNAKQNRILLVEDD